MNWQQFWDRQAQQFSNPQAQVGRIRAGHTLGEDVLKDILEHIRTQLSLQAEDRLLDVCCGNGLLSQRLAEHCKLCLGLDLSAAQIELAKQHAIPSKLMYAQADATQLEDFFKKSFQELTFNKINLYFSFQYFDSYQKGKQAIAGMLSRLEKGGLIFIGDVPDQSFFSQYYATPVSRLRYQFRKLLGTNDMGKFWSVKEMEKIGEELGVQIIRLSQPTHLPYASYRCDYLILT